MESKWVLTNVNMARGESTPKNNLFCVQLGSTIHYPLHELYLAYGDLIYFRH
jgi:hypothetical protein